MIATRFRIAFYNTFWYFISTLIMAWSILGFQIGFLGLGDRQKWGSASGAMFIGCYFSLVAVAISAASVLLLMILIPASVFSALARKHAITLNCIAGIISGILIYVFWEYALDNVPLVLMSIGLGTTLGVWLIGLFGIRYFKLFKVESKD